MKELKKVSRFSSLLIVIGAVFGVLAFASCGTDRVGAVIKLPNIPNKSDLGDIIVLLKKEGNIESVYTLAAFERLSLRRFTNPRARFDEVVFFAIPAKGISVKWAISINGNLFDVPPSVGTKLSVPVEYISQSAKVKIPIMIDCEFFIQDTIIE